MFSSFACRARGGSPKIASPPAALYLDMGSPGGIVRRILALAILVFSTAAATADSVAMTVWEFGLVGNWAIDCTKELSAVESGFRILVAEPSGGAPTYTTISVDAGVKTTVDSIVQAAVLLSPRRLKLTLRIVGGNRDGFPLPSPTTNTFEQTFEIIGNGRLQMVRTDPISFQRCPN
jgi:hypothetical protein